MSALNSGIVVDQALTRLYSNPQVSGILVNIQNEKFTPVKTSGEQTWSQLVNDVKSWFEPESASFMILKQQHPVLLASAQSHDEEATRTHWTLIAFIPEASPVRDKMLYSASKQLLLKSLPASNTWSVFASTCQEVSEEGLRRFAESEAAPTPLSEREKEKKAMLLEEASSAIGLSARASNASSLCFPLTSVAETSLKKCLLGSDGGLVALEILNETTDLCVEKPQLSTLQDLGAFLATHAATPLFLFFSVHANPSHILFAYISPPTAKVKERMLYGLSSQRY